MIEVTYLQKLITTLNYLKERFDLYASEAINSHLKSAPFNQRFDKEVITPLMNLIEEVENEKVNLTKEENKL